MKKICFNCGDEVLSKYKNKRFCCAQCRLKFEENKYKESNSYAIQTLKLLGITNPTDDIVQQKLMTLKIKRKIKQITNENRTTINS